MPGELTPLYIDGACASALAARYLQGQMICREGVGGDWYDPDDSFELRLSTTNPTEVIASRGVAFVAERRDSEIPSYYFVASEDDESGFYQGQTAGARDIWLIIQDSNEQGVVNGWTLAFFPTDWANPTNMPGILLGTITGDGQTITPGSLVDKRTQFQTCTTGEPSSLTVGEVEKLPWTEDPTVEITGRPPHQTIDFGIPGGEPNKLTIGTVTTGAPGDPATASITGTPPSQVLNLGIPTGAAGPQGPQGPRGPAGGIQVGRWVRMAEYGKVVLGAISDIASSATKPSAVTDFTPFVIGSAFNDDDLVRVILYSPVAAGPEAMQGLVADSSAPGAAYRVSIPYSGSSSPSALDIIATGAQVKGWQGSGPYAMGLAATYNASATALYASIPGISVFGPPQLQMNTAGTIGLSSSEFPQTAPTQNQRFVWSPAQQALYVDNASQNLVQGGSSTDFILSAPIPCISMTYYPPVAPPATIVSISNRATTGAYWWNHMPWGLGDGSTQFGPLTPRQVVLFPELRAQTGSMGLGRLRGSAPPSISQVGTTPGGSRRMIQGEAPLAPQCAVYRWDAF